jgi:hypothetical protein
MSLYESNTIKTQLQKYCVKIDRNQRSILNKQWITLQKCNISVIDLKLEKIYELTENPFLEIILVYRCYKSLLSICENLTKLGFNKVNNFTAACTAYCSIIMIFLVNKKVQSLQEIDYMIESLTLYIMLYIIVDHTIDSNPEILDTFKQDFSNILKGLNVTKEYTQNEACYYLKKLLELNPKSRQHIIDVAIIEFKSIEEQYNTSHDLLEMCYLKGEKSTIAGCSIITNGEVLNGSNLVGRLGQLFDDIVDIDDDIKDGINTYVTECLVENGNIDCCIDLFVEIFNSLPFEYECVKSILLYLVSTHLINNKYISNEMRNIFRDYSLIFFTG